MSKKAILKSSLHSIKQHYITEPNYGAKFRHHNPTIYRLFNAAINFPESMNISALQLSDTFAGNQRKIKENGKRRYGERHLLHWPRQFHICYCLDII